MMQSKFCFQFLSNVFEALHVHRFSEPVTPATHSLRWKFYSLRLLFHTLSPHTPRQRIFQLPVYCLSLPRKFHLAGTTVYKSSSRYSIFTCKGKANSILSGCLLSAALPFTPHPLLLQMGGPSSWPLPANVSENSQGKAQEIRASHFYIVCCTIPYFYRLCCSKERFLKFSRNKNTHC